MWFVATHKIQIVTFRNYGTGEMGRQEVITASGASYMEYNIQEINIV